MGDDTIAAAVHTAVEGSDLSRYPFAAAGNEVSFRVADRPAGYTLRLHTVLAGVGLVVVSDGDDERGEVRTLVVGWADPVRRCWHGADVAAVERDECADCANDPLYRRVRAEVDTERAYMAAAMRRMRAAPGIDLPYDD